MLSKFANKTLRELNCWRLTKMKYLNILYFFVLIFLSTIVEGQQLVFFKFYSKVSFMPTGGFKKETYQMVDNKLNHFTETLSYKNPTKTIKKILTKDANYINEINDLDSLIKLKSFTLTVDSSLILQLKSDTFSKQFYKIENLDIDNFFGNKKTITLSLSDIKPDTLDSYTVYDGRPFTLYFVFKRNLQNITELNYSGNIDDGVKAKDIKYWLPTFLLITKYKLFSTNNHINDFFDDRNLRSILFRFIKWQTP